MPREGAGPDFIEALARGLEVIAAFRPGRPAPTLAEVAAATGLARPTARRILLTLAELGYVRADGGTFALTPTDVVTTVLNSADPFTVTVRVDNPSLALVKWNASLELSLIGKARREGLVDLHVHDLRQWTHDRHRTVDDTPLGGGAGMVMKPEPWAEAFSAVREAGQASLGADVDPLIVFPNPAGAPFAQGTAQEWAQCEWLVFACGRYEGIDERVIEDAAERMPVEEVSIGDYVLVGGEAAVLVMVEAVARLLPGVLGNPLSAQQDSFSDGLLEGPCYTRPEVWRGRSVPDVLRSGNHAAIARWRRDKALERTYWRRPDLLAALPEGALDEADRAVLDKLRESDRSGDSRDAGDAERGPR